MPSTRLGLAGALRFPPGNARQRRVHHKSAALKRIYCSDQREDAATGTAKPPADPAREERWQQQVLPPASPPQAELSSEQQQGQAPHSRAQQEHVQQWEPSQPAAGTPPLFGSRRLEGLAYLLTVSLLWGSYTPALRLAYSLPAPPTPVALTAVSGCLELVVLLAAMLLSSAVSSSGGSADAAPAPQPTGSGSGSGNSNSNSGSGSSMEGSRDPILAPSVASAPADPSPVTANEGRLWLLVGLPAAVLAGLEIGLYNSGATLSQLAGLSLTTATRGAFLIQASILFTPVLASLAGMAPGRQVWAGSLLALAGTVLITLDHTAAAPAADASTSIEAAAAAAASTLSPVGDALTVFAALCYSAATVRMPVWSVQRGVTPLQLSLGKATLLTVVALVALAAEVAWLSASGQSAIDLWPGWQQPEGWAIVIWAALGPGALASFLHVKGQSLVSPTDAQIVFCSVPVWSALLAAAALPDEPVGLITWLGGAVIGSAGLVAATSPEKQAMPKVQQ